MEEPRDPAVQRRRLATELRRARADAGLTQKQVAAELDWSPSKILRVEQGQVGISRTDLKALLDQYGVADPELRAQLALLAQQGKRQVWSRYRGALHSEFITYLGFEGVAATIRELENLFVPGLLQTEEYARAIIRGVSLGESRARREKQLEARMRRQLIFQQPDPPDMHFILDEAVVRRWVGSRPRESGIMRRQLEHLRRAARLPHVRLQIMPFSAGPHLGMAGQFVILEFASDEEGDLLFMERGRQAATTRKKPEELVRYKKEFLRLAAMADDGAAFCATIDRIMAEMR